MIQTHRLRDGADVAVFGDGDGVHVYMRAGRSRVALQLGPQPARALLTDLHAAIGHAAPETRRPGAPRYHPGRPPPYAAIMARLREGRPTDTDIDTLSALLAYFGVQT